MRRSVLPPTPPPALTRPTHAQPRGSDDELRVTAVGHSTFLLQLGALNILTDPVWGERASPVRFAGPRRRHAPGVALSELPPIDIVLQSHDHYDHLDDHSVRAIAAQHPGATWCAPLGVGARLRSRGVRHVVERDWWGQIELGAAQVTCVPAAHFSGRTPFDRDRTLWSGWAVAANRRHVYFVGDSGSHPDFAAIGRRLGALDLVLMPIGAYEPRWFMRPVHMDPDEAVAALLALTAQDARQGTIMVAMHWGTFLLADEHPEEPPRRARAAWAAAGRPSESLWVLAPGETRRLTGP